MTFMFVVVMLGATHQRAPAGFAGIAIGLCLTLIHLVSIPVTNTSVNPARSTGPALFVGGWALQQLWLFWVAPIVGAVLAGWSPARCSIRTASRRSRVLVKPRLRRDTPSPPAGRNDWHSGRVGPHDWPASASRWIGRRMVGRDHRH